MMAQSVPEIGKRVKHTRALQAACESSPLSRRFVKLPKVKIEEAESMSTEITIILMLVAFIVGMMTGISLARPGTR